MWARINGLFANKTETKNELSETEQKVKKLESNYKELKIADAKIGGVSAGSIYLWSLAFGWGFIPGLLGITAVSSAIHIFNKKHAEHGKKFKAYKESAEALLIPYQNLVKANGGTHDPKALELLEKIAPYITNTDALLPPSFYNDPKSCSIDFFEILAKPPHNLPNFLRVKALSVKQENEVHNSLFANNNSLPFYDLILQAEKVARQFSERNPACARLKSAAFQLAYGIEGRRMMP